MRVEMVKLGEGQAVECEALVGQGWEDEALVKVRVEIGRHEVIEGWERVLFSNRLRLVVGQGWKGVTAGAW